MCTPEYRAARRGALAGGVPQNTIDRLYNRDGSEQPERWAQFRTKCLQAIGYTAVLTVALTCWFASHTMMIKSLWLPEGPALLLTARRLEHRKEIK